MRSDSEKMNTCHLLTVVGGTASVTQSHPQSHYFDKDEAWSRWYREKRKTLLLIVPPRWIKAGCFITFCTVRFVCGGEWQCSVSLLFPIAIYLKKKFTSPTKTQFSVPFSDGAAVHRGHSLPSLIHSFPLNQREWLKRPWLVGEFLILQLPQTSITL